MGGEDMGGVEGLASCIRLLSGAVAATTGSRCNLYKAGDKGELGQAEQVLQLPDGCQASGHEHRMGN